MPINLNKTMLYITDPNLQEAWGDLQGNIVKSHGRDHSRHVFLRFTSDKKQCRALLSTLAGRVTSALEQYNTAREYQTNGTEHVFTGVALSATGYNALGVEEKKVPWDKAFRRGMKDLKSPYDTISSGDHRPTANPLNDRIEDWDEAFTERIDAVVMFAYGGRAANSSECDAILDAEVAKLQNEVSQVADILLIQSGHAMRNEKGQVIEHFGYTDGVSDPLFLRSDTDKALENGGLDRYDPSANVGSVIVPDPGGGSCCESYGSYMVYRKLQQNIKGFHTKVSAMSSTLSSASGKEISPATAGAMVIGRFQDGTPLSEQSVDGWTNLFNNYDFDNDVTATRCPFAAHARKTNPRGDAARQLGEPITNERSRRIARRGISYGDTDLKPDEEWTDAGLLFLSFQADIEQQFIFMQNTWCNNQNFVNKEVGLDPVIGQLREGEELKPQKWPTAWGKPSEHVEFGFHDCVRTRGGEYFFAPSISFLKGL